MRRVRPDSVWLAATLLAAGCQRDDAPNAAPTPAEVQVATAWFVDVTEKSGVVFTHDAGLSPEKHLPETMGAGAAIVDVDDDGDLDLYLLQGGPMPSGGSAPGSFTPDASSSAVNRLFLNDGAGRFEDATARSGAAAHNGYAMGVAAGDVNGDGHVDFYVTNLGPDVLLIGDGKGSFVDATAASGIADERWTTAATFFDSDGDGDLDLYVTGYVLVDLAHPLWCGDRKPGRRSACHPDAYAGLQDRLWINQGDGSFRDETIARGLADSFGKGLGVIAFDVEEDGDLDLYVANDSTENRLWLNRGDGSFEDGTLLAGVGVNGRGLTEAGMGLAVGDIDGDLDLDVFVTNFDDESNTLYSNQGEALFDDVSIQAGLEAPSRLPVGFGCVLEDFDLDGDLDLAVANGHIIDNIHLYHDGKTHAQRAQLFENDGAGRFSEIGRESGALGVSAQVGRGLYAGDLDGDGDADLLLTCCGGQARVLRNVVASPPSLRLRGAPRNSVLCVSARNGRSVLRTALGQISYFGSSSSEVIVPNLEAWGGIERVSMRAPYDEERALTFEGPLAGALEIVRRGDLWFAVERATAQR